jgi:hypothetical protein
MATHPGITERLELKPGTLPDDIPANADIYLLKNTLHCLDEASCRATLDKLRAVIGDRHYARVLIIEGIIPEGNAFDWVKLMDIEMMVNCGSRERTLPEWRSLAQASGFTIGDITELIAPQWAIELIPDLR